MECLSTNDEQDLLISEVSRDFPLLRVGIILENFLQKEGAVKSIQWLEPVTEPRTQSDILVKLEINHAHELLKKAVIEIEGETWKIKRKRATKLKSSSTFQSNVEKEEEPMAVDEVNPYSELHEIVFNLQRIDTDILEFLLRSEYVYNRMERLFRYHATLNITKEDPAFPSNIIIKMIPMPREGVKSQSQVEFRNTSAILLERFFSMIVSEKRRYPTEDLVALRERKSYSELIPRKIEGEEEHQFLVKWVDESDPGMVKVVGFVDDVMPFITFLNNQILPSTKQTAQKNVAQPEERIQHQPSEAGTSTETSSLVSNTSRKDTAVEKKKVPSPEVSSSAALTPPSIQSILRVAEREEKDCFDDEMPDLVSADAENDTAITNKNGSKLKTNSVSSSSSSVKSTDEVNHKKIDKKNFSKTFTWFKLLQEDVRLFFGNEDKCALVQHLPSNCTYKELRSYLTGCGGRVKRIVRISDGILVVFKDKSAVDAIAGEVHTYGEKTFSILKKQIPGIDNERLLIEGDFDDKEDVTTLLKTCVTDVDAKIKRTKKPKRFLIRFSGQTDVLGIIKKIRKLPLSGFRPKVSRICCSDCIKIKGADGLTDDRLKIAFKKKRFNISFIERCEEDDDVAIVYLCDYRDCDTIVKSSVQINKQTLEIYPFIQDIAKLKEIKENPDIEEEFNQSSSSTNNTNPESSLTHAINKKVEMFRLEEERDSPVLQLIHSSEDLQTNLSAEFIGLATVELNQPKSKFNFVKFTPTIKQKINFGGDQDMFERECKKVYLKYLATFISIDHKPSHEIYQRMAKTYRKNDEPSTIVDEDDMRILLTWNSSRDGFLKLTGLKTHVNSFKDTFDEKIVTWQCDEEQYTTLLTCGILDDVQKKFNVVISKCNNTFSLLLEGTVLNTESAKKMFAKELKDLKRSPLSFLNEAQQQFLVENSTSPFGIQSHIQKELTNNGLKVLFLMKTKPLLIYKPRDFKRCKGVLESLIKCKSLDFPEDIDQIENDEHWKEVRGFVTETGALSIQRTKLKLTLVGLSPYFEEAQKRITTFFSLYAEKEEVFKMEDLYKSFLCNLTTELEGSEILQTVDFYEAPNGVTLVGKKRNLLKVSEWLKEVSRSLQTSSKEINEPWKVKYLLGESGKQFLHRLQVESKCFVKLEKEAAEMQRSPPASFVPPKEKVSLAANWSTRLPVVKVPGTEVTIRLVQGDITAHQVDAIVNASNEELELRSAGVSGSILAKGGGRIQREMDEQRKQIGGKLPRGEAVTTGAGFLRCKKVIHVSGPVWYEERDFKGSSKCLKNSVQACLSEAERHGLSSIAIPAISCGVFGGKPDVSAKIIVQAIVEYFKEKFLKKSSVKTVDLIELSNSRIISEFSKELNSFSLGTSSPTIEKERSLLTSHAFPSRGNEKSQSVGVIVDHGNILMTAVDCIVNTAGPNFDLKASKLSQNLLQEAGSSLTQEMQSPYHQSKIYKVTSGGNMPFRRIVHLIIPRSPSQISSDLLKVFRLVDEKMKMNSLAVPAIGTGNASFTEHEAVSLMKSAIKDFFKTKPKNLKRINVVVYEERFVELYKSALRDITVPGQFSEASTSRKNYGYQDSSNVDPVPESAPVNRPRSNYDPVMLCLCSTKQENLEKASTMTRFQFEKRFAESIMKDIPAEAVPDSFLNKLKERHTVRICKETINSKSNVVISGLQEDVSSTCSVLKPFVGTSSAGHSSNYDEGEWIL